ncbi:hypothetical protein Bbelb_006370 [Branchiostoma belcheri]|nr:hypothetical protein Bbelb_006370 [Branchiostoma belcheri]
MAAILFIIMVASTLVSNNNGKQLYHNGGGEPASEARIHGTLFAREHLDSLSAFYEKTPKPALPEDGDPFGAYDPLRASETGTENEDEHKEDPGKKIETVVRQRRMLY